MRHRPPPTKMMRSKSHGGTPWLIVFINSFPFRLLAFRNITMSTHGAGRSWRSGSSAAPEALCCSAVGVSHRARVGGARVRWLRKREERLRNHRMGCLPVVNRMLSRSNEGAVDSFAPSARCCPACPASKGPLAACRPFRALTLWNSLAASR